MFGDARGLFSCGGAARGAECVSGGVGVVAGPSAFASSISESQPVASAEPVTFSDGGGVVSD